jgi:hypothetical protein
MIIYKMGRTIPSFRIASEIEKGEWKPFRNALGKSDRKVFDEMFSIARLYNSACSYAANPVRINPNIHVHYISSLQTAYQTIRTAGVVAEQARVRI